MSYPNYPPQPPPGYGTMGWPQPSAPPFNPGSGSYQGYYNQGYPPPVPADVYHTDHHHHHHHGHHHHDHDHHSHGCLSFLRGCLAALCCCCLFQECCGCCF